MMRTTPNSASSSSEDKVSSLLSVLQDASKAWTTFDWEGKLTQLQKAATNTREQKELSLAARKVLADTTKVFKKSVKSMEQSFANLESKIQDTEITTAVKLMDALAKDLKVHF
jgi:hypothetical protein